MTELSIIVALISSSLAAYNYVSHGETSFLTLYFMSTVSLQLLIESFKKGLYNLQSILGYLSITVVYELIALWVVLNSLPLSFFVFVFSINMLLALLMDFEFYDLRSFLHRALN